MISTTIIISCYRQDITFKARRGAHGVREIREPVEYEGVPPEVWLSSFSFLQDDKLDLMNITLVSRSFAALAQPLISSFARSVVNILAPAV
jgi:hypothetical protein